MIDTIVTFSRHRSAVSRHKALNDLRAMEPVTFERWVAQRFREMGYSVKMTAATGDHGIDLKLRRGSVLAIVQCKRWQNVVGESIVRDLSGAMHDQRAKRAFLVTTGEISSAARYWASGKPIDLWDGQYLAELASARRAPNPSQAFDLDLEAT